MPFFFIRRQHIRLDGVIITASVQPYRWLFLIQSLIDTQIMLAYLLQKTYFKWNITNLHFYNSFVNRAWKFRYTLVKLSIPSNKLFSKKVIFLAMFESCFYRTNIDFVIKRPKKNISNITHAYIYYLLWLYRYT